MGEEGEGLRERGGDEIIIDKAENIKYCIYTYIYIYIYIILNQRCKLINFENLD